MASNHKDTTQIVWDELAAGFDAYVTPLGFSIAEDVLGLADLRGGDLFLDIAAGSGALSIPAARLGAEVLATDISPAMIDRLQARAAAEGMGNVDGRVMDAYDLDLADDTFDVAGSIAGVTILPDVGRALSEMVRVTKPGGCAVVVNFGPPEKGEFADVFMGAMQAVVPGFTPTGEGPVAVVPTRRPRTDAPRTGRRGMARRQSGNLHLAHGVRIRSAFAPDFRSS